ncbi:helix-turn-helix transcriptional regulator [Clostridium botulinum D/C]|uniref:helix-turn-helix domain-containing protein n=1 Tax=Clostridium botulinum TaxID=1491 RepID=UPI001E474339|nr:helix-turn-helix transcriptional regulator [Clostridium botulinum]MCD3240850.1 helix-turn-helix transcriptional regulator [Clostridium botulinum D/C]
MLSGRRLKDLRLTLNVSQDEVAQRMGVSRNYISMLENEKQGFSKDIYDKWINALYGKYDKRELK